jgi:hypothetical protein
MQNNIWIVFLVILALAILTLIEGPLSSLSDENTSPLEPSFSLPGGYYDRDIQLTITSPNPNASVIFTVDGSVPTHTVGTTYTHPIHLGATAPAVTVIRARAILPDGRLGPVISASYVVSVPANLPIMSLIMEPDDLWSAERGIYTNFDGRGDNWERSVDITYVDRDRRSGFHIPAGIRIHGGRSRAFDKKALRLYFRQEYGASRLEYPLFIGTEGVSSRIQSFKRLVLHNGGQDGMTINNMNWTLMRNRLVESLALELGGHATQAQPVLLFINGNPWGIYQIRERIDSRFFLDHYGIESVDFLDSPEHDWDKTVLMGDRGHWDHLLQFVESHDMTSPANYAYVESQVDIANFIDYFLIHIYAANVDWPAHNTQQFRPRVQGGRWRWLFWDSDRSLGARAAAPYSRVDMNLVERLQIHDDPKTNGRDVLLWRKLLGNPAFVLRFLRRASDLLNTALAPPSVIAHIDALAAELEPDIAYELIRWSSSTNWEANVQELRDFARRRPDFVRQHIVDGFNLDGTVQITFNPPASGSGTVAVNGNLVQNLPWRGVYFQSIPIQITAAPTPGYRFAGWDPPGLPQSPTITLTASTGETITARFEAIRENTPRAGDVVFGHIEKDRFELRVMRSGGIDLRRWRVTDNDAKTATDEGSLIFDDVPAFAHIPKGTTIQIVVTSTGNECSRPDDLSTWNRQMILYTHNPNLDTETDPGFNLGPNDALILLAPGPTEALDDDRGIAFVSLPGSTSHHASAVTPASFGVLADGVFH